MSKLCICGRKIGLQDDGAAGARGVAHTGGADDASRAGACSVGGSSRCSYASGPAHRGGGGPARASYVDDGPARRRGGGGGARDYCRLRDGGGAGYVDDPVRRDGGASSSSGSLAHYVDGPRAGRAAVAGAVAARRRSLTNLPSV